jgi:hypothetical protein
MSGVKIELYDTAAPGVVIKTKTTDNSGSAPTFYVPAGTAGHTYGVRARIPLASISGTTFKNWKCKIDGTDCLVNLSNGLTLGIAKPTVNLQGVDVTDDTAGGGDIGNPNCDGIVGSTDLMALKSSYGASEGECCYRAWADFDMNGSVGGTDLMLLRKYYNTSLKLPSGTTTVPAALCRSANPLPACCGRGTCKHVPTTNASCR